MGADELVINMGPQHPSTHGVLRVKLKLDGERVNQFGVRHRVFAPGRGENRGEPHVSAICSLRRSHGLCRGGQQRIGVLRGGGKIADGGSSTAGGVIPNHLDGTAENRQSPAVASARML